jgi:hypothetical protein
MKEYDFIKDGKALEEYIQEKQSLNWCYFERGTLSRFAYNEFMQELNEQYRGIAGSLLPVALDKI